MKHFITGVLLVTLMAACSPSPTLAAKDTELMQGEQAAAAATHADEAEWPVQKADEEWKSILSLEQYRVMREQCTEAPFTGKYHNHKEPGVYVLAGVGTPLFTSKAKYDSGTGWPSFFEPYAPGAVKEVTDYSHGMVRTEIVDAKTGSHLGHVFPAPNTPTGLRYCINSAALDFIPQAEWDEMQAEKAAAGEAATGEVAADAAE